MLEKLLGKPDWRNYLERTKDDQPPEILVTALSYVKEKGTALDAGAGSLSGSRYLVEQGFHKVIALEPENVSQYVGGMSPEKFELITQTMEKFAFPDAAYDLVSAQMSLPFVNKKHLHAVLKSMKRSLKLGGIWTGTFFGERHSWNTFLNPNRASYLTEAEVRELFEDMEVLVFDTYDKPSERGTEKCWHEFRIVARKK